jgi:hypothetical protein
MGYVVNGKLRVFATPNNVSMLTAGPIPRGNCWPGKFDDPADLARAKAQVASESPEYYLLSYSGLNDLIAQVRDLLQSQTWTSGAPPVVHHLPCLDTLELSSHGNEFRSGGVCADDIQEFVDALEGLRYCDGLNIYLSGCNTGLRGGIAEQLARAIPSMARARQYRCVVYGVRGYLTGSNAGKNGEVSKEYEGSDGEKHAAHGPDAADAKRDPASPQDDSYQGYLGPNSARIMTVELIDLKTQFRLQLDPRRARWLVEELRHEKRVRPHKRGIQSGSEAACRILVNDRGRTRDYELFDRTVILEESTGRSWQFFFGMVANEWLLWAQNPAPAFQPVIRI